MGEESIIKITCSRDVARYFLFLKRERNLNFGEIKFKNISAKSLYFKNKDIFDRFFEIAVKYKIDIKSYLSFYVLKLNKAESSIPFDFLNVNTLNLYCENKKISEQYEKIYSYFNKSVDNIVNVCKEKNYQNVKEYLKRLILDNKLGELVISGKISIYYLATIPNIRQLIMKMDQINRDELKIILDRKDELNKSVQDAFLHMKSQYVNPISYANERLNA